MDFVFCIDCSAGIAPYLDSIKSTLRRFVPVFLEYVAREYHDQYDFEEINCKIIGFRNYQVDGQDAMFQSDWFDISAGDDVDFERYVNSLQASGGQTDANNGLEALFYAMATDWNAPSSNLL